MHVISVDQMEGCMAFTLRSWNHGKFEPTCLAKVGIPDSQVSHGGWSCLAGRWWLTRCSAPGQHPTSCAAPAIAGTKTLHYYILIVLA